MVHYRSRITQDYHSAGVAQGTLLAKSLLGQVLKWFEQMVLITPRIEVDTASPYGGRLVVTFPKDSGCETFSVPLNATQELVDTWPAYVSGAPSSP